MTKPKFDKLNIGCGNDILEDWVNHDIANLPGVDVVHDLTVFPWPFESNSFNQIQMINVLEHLPDTIRTLEEIFRISAVKAKVTIRVPYWNSPDMITDPTHKVFFNEHSFDFFDPSKRHCKERPYYSNARFLIKKKYYYIRFIKYIRISSLWIQKLLEFLSKHFAGIIWVIEFELQTIK